MLVLSLTPEHRRRLLDTVVKDLKGIWNGTSSAMNPDSVLRRYDGRARIRRRRSERLIALWTLWNAVPLLTEPVLFIRGNLLFRQENVARVILDFLHLSSLNILQSSSYQLFSFTPEYRPLPNVSISVC